MTEIWKDIAGYEGLYQVSNLGSVKSIDRKVFGKEHLFVQFKKGKIKKAHLSGKGYLKVVLYKENKPKRCYVHRLVAETFLNNPNNLPQVNHKDENKLNNNVSNLEWCTNKYNCNYGTKNERMINTRLKNKTL